MSDIETLIKTCKCGVHITVNNHRDYYQTIPDYIRSRAEYNEDVPNEEMIGRMVEADTMIEIQCYPETPIGFFRIWHYDINEGLKEAVQATKENRR